MPRLSVFYIRCSLVYFLLGSGFGMLLLWQKGGFLSVTVWRYLPLHLELLTFGWIVQLVMGVAYWILPRFSRAPLRGNPRLAWGAFGALNAGVLLSAIHPWLPAAEMYALAGRLLEMLSIALFAAGIWPRIKPFADAA